MSEQVGKSGNRLLLVSTVVAFAILVTLGTWQLQRLNWKLDLVEKRQQALTSDPIKLSDIDAGIEHGYDVDWFKVQAVGSYRHDLERHVYHLRNGKIGWRIITPFVVPGQFVMLVDRGFVPDERKHQDQRQVTAADEHRDDRVCPCIPGQGRLVYA